MFSTEDGQRFKNLHPTLRLQQPEQLHASIPIVVHEDAAPYGKKRSVNVLQWGPLLVRGSDIELRFVHHGYIAKQGDSADTAQRAWSNFWEDVDRLAEGWPKADRSLAECWPEADRLLAKSAGRMLADG